MSRVFIIALVAISCGTAQSAGPVPTNAESVRVAGSLIEIKADAEAGYRKAQAQYADALKASQHFAAAEHWYRAAAIQGEPSALCSLAELYQFDRGAGTNRVKADPTNSVILNRLAALQGYAPAHFALFFAYRDGKNTPRNLVEGYKHLLLSEANATREDLARQMVLQMRQQEIRDAELQAKYFKPLSFVKAFEELVFESIRIGGTMGTDADRVAFINGGVVAPSGTLRIRVAGLPAVIKCRSISRDAVTIVFNGTERAIPFKGPNPMLVRATPGLTAR
jgi:hypothetical protein